MVRSWGSQNQAGVPTWESYRINAGATGTVENDSSGQPLGVRNGNTPVAYLPYDGLGRLAAMVRPDGSVMNRYTTGPYGHVQQINDAAGRPGKPPAVQTMNSPVTTNPWTTIGVPALVNGYWKRGTRWNDTLTSTWTSVDPLTFLNDPSRANPYHYAQNDPINMTDPSGQLPGCDVAAGLAGADAGFAARMMGIIYGASAVASGGASAAVGLGVGLLATAACDGDFG